MKEQDNNDIEILNTPTYTDEFQGMKLEDVIWGMHQVIKKQEEEIAELKKQLTGHLPSLNKNY